LLLAAAAACRRHRHSVARTRFQITLFHLAQFPFTPPVPINMSDSWEDKPIQPVGAPKANPFSNLAASAGAINRIATHLKCCVTLIM